MTLVIQFGASLRHNGSMRTLDALRRVLFLKTLSTEALAEIATSGRQQLLQKGEMLFREHEPTRGLIVVLSGAVKLYKLDPRGRELIISREEPGESVAELPLFDGGNYPMSSEAIEDGTIVFIVPRDRFLELMTRYPEISRQATRTLAVRMRKLLHMVEAQALHSVRARLAAYLLTQGKGRDSFRLEQTNEEIGGEIGTVRDVVSRTLRGLQDDHLLRIDGRTVYVLDRANMKRVASNNDMI